MMVCGCDVFEFEDGVCDDGLVMCVMIVDVWSDILSVVG